MIQHTPDIGAQREFYDERWAVFETPNHAKVLRAGEILRAIAELGFTTPRILDLGCGTGWLGSMLSAIGPTTGVDLSPLAIGRASEFCPTATFVAADILNWDHPAESFDLVVSHEVIEHFEDHGAYLDAAFRLLAPGGFLVLTTPNATIFRRELELNAGYEGQPIENWVDRRTMRTLLRSRSSRSDVRLIRPTRTAFGWRRLAFGNRAHRIAERLCLRHVFDECALAAGAGLHLLAIAQKAR